MFTFSLLSAHLPSNFRGNQREGKPLLLQPPFSPNPFHLRPCIHRRHHLTETAATNNHVAVQTPRDQPHLRGSAQDLPPLSKMLRTFAFAYISPDHKLTTKIDYKGHTNPNWNYKMLFHVDQHFLNQDSSVLTIDIYNLAWLRDLPIGTARLQFNTLSPPLTQSNGYRKISLQICRPSGHLQGTVSLNIQLVDMEDDVSLSSLRISDEESVAEEKKEENPHDPEPEEEEKPCPENKSTDESICSMPETKYTWQLESEPETRTVTSGENRFTPPCGRCRRRWRLI